VGYEDSLEFALQKALDEGKIAGQLRELSEELVRTSERFNAWVLRVAKRSYDEEGMMRVIDIQGDAEEAAMAAWRSYASTPSQEAEHLLTRALVRSRDTMSSLIQERPEL
jgi:hypothetical protein